MAQRPNEFIEIADYTKPRLPIKCGVWDKRIFYVAAGEIHFHCKGCQTSHVIPLSVLNEASDKLIAMQAQHAPDAKPTRNIVSIDSLMAVNEALKAKDEKSIMQEKETGAA